VPDVDCFNSH